MPSKAPKRARGANGRQSSDGSATPARMSQKLDTAPRRPKRSTPAPTAARAIRRRSVGAPSPIQRLLGLLLVAIVGCLGLLVLAHSTASFQGGQGLRGAPPQQSCRPDASGIPEPGPCGDTWRYAQAVNAQAHVLAPPSVSVAAIQQALTSADSPLADTTATRDSRTYAEYLWDQGKRSGVDPGMVMGFFNAESSYGTQGMSTQTHDLANERALAGRPSRCSNDGCYVYDDTWFDGIDRIVALLADYAHRGLDTADKVIPIWAPTSDYNNDLVMSGNVRATVQALHAAS